MLNPEEPRLSHCDPRYAQSKVLVKRKNGCVKFDAIFDAPIV